MRKNLIVLMAVASTALLFSTATSPVFAQGFSLILEKLDKLELKINNLEQRINEGSQKSQDISGLESRLNGLEKQVSSVAASKPDISGLENRLASLEADLSNPETNQDWDFIENSIVELAFQVKQLEDNYTAGNISGGAGMDGQYLAQLQEITEDLKTTVAEFAGHPEGKPEKSSVKFDRTPKISGLLKSYWQYDQYESGDDKNNIKLKYGRVAIKGGVSDDVGYKLQFDFTRNGDDMLLDGAVYFNPTLWSKMTVGQFKTPYSTINLRSASKQRFIDKPMMNSKTSPPTRDVGFSLTSKNSQFSTTVGVFNGSGQNSSDVNNAKNAAGRITWAGSAKLNLSANIYYGKTNEADSLYEDLMMYNGGFGFKHEKFAIEGEYGYYETESLKRTGFYLDAVYDHPLTGIVKTITPGFRYEWYDSDTDTPDDAKWRYTAGLKLVFAKLPNMHVRADYQYNEVESGTVDKNTFLTEIQLTF